MPHRVHRRHLLVPVIASLLAVAGCSLGAASSPSASPSPSIATIPVHLRTSENTNTSRGHNDPDGLWAAVEADQAKELQALDDPSLLLQHQRAWRRAVEADFPPGGDITCDPRTFMPLRDSYVVTVGVLVNGSDADVLKAALDRAGARMMAIAYDGRELTAKELNGETGSSADPPFTIAYVSEAERSGMVVGIQNVDTKGERYPWMFRSFIRVVAEELRRAGAVPARIVPYLDPDTQQWLKERHERYPTDSELG
jgi:hypothetical protein